MSVATVNFIVEVLSNLEVFILKVCRPYKRLACCPYVYSSIRTSVKITVALVYHCLIMRDKDDLEYDSYTDNVKFPLPMR